MLLLFLTFLAQITVPGVLSGPDPAQWRPPRTWDIARSRPA